MTTASLPTLPTAAFGMFHMSAGLTERFGDMAQLVAGQLFAKHTRNDWGDLCPEDKEANAEVLLTGEGRLMSSYEVAGTKVWVISYIQSDPELQAQPDYCNTCALLPEDY